MDWLLRRHYIGLVKFLGAALGPDYEVILYKINDEETTVLAIANGQTEQQAGTVIPTNDFKITEHFNQKLSPERNKHYTANYTSTSAQGKKIRSSSLLIKNSQSKLVGVLRLNFNDARFLALSQQILSLCHPDALLSAMRFEQVDEAYFNQHRNDYSYKREDITQITQAIIHKTIEQQTGNHPISKNEKMATIAHLNEQGVFLVKGSVAFVAKQLRLSEASVYRYIAELPKAI